MGEDVREAAFKVKAPLELSRKPVFWVAGFRQAIGKREGISGDSSKLDPVIFPLFFCAFHAHDHALRDRPADGVCGIARGGAPQRNGGHHRTSPPSGSPDGNAVRVCAAN